MLNRLNLIGCLASLPLSLLSAGCGQFEPPETATMGALEKASYMALRRYDACMRQVIKRTKAGPALSDDAVNALGYQCRKELRDAAVKREHYWSAENRIQRDDRLYFAPTREARIALQESDLATYAWCDFRKCPRTD